MLGQPWSGIAPTKINCWRVLYGTETPYVSIFWADSAVFQALAFLGVSTQKKDLPLFFMLKSLLFALWKCADFGISDEAWVFKPLWLLKSMN